MIIILHRGDLPMKRDRHTTVEDITLNLFGLPRFVLQYADVIVFIEGDTVKFLKQPEGLVTREDLNVLVQYITAATPAPQPTMDINTRGLGRRRPHGNEKPRE